MSIKRISRRRIAAPVTEYVDEGPLATKIAGELDNARVGGDVETKANPSTATSIGGDIEARVGSNVETRDGSYSKWSA